MGKAQMDNEQRQHLLALQEVYQKRLRVLEMQAAKLGLHTPTHIPAEIDDTNAALAAISLQLDGQAPSAGPTSPTAILLPAPFRTSNARVWVLLAALLGIGSIALIAGYQWGVSAEQQRIMPTIASYQTAVQGAHVAVAQPSSPPPTPAQGASPAANLSVTPDPNMAVMVTSREDKQFTVSFESLRFKDTIAGLTLAAGTTYYFKDMQRFRVTNAESANSDVEITLLDGAIVTGRVNDCDRCYLSGSARKAPDAQPGEDLFLHLSDVRRVEFNR